MTVDLDFPVEADPGAVEGTVRLQGGVPALADVSVTTDLPDGARLIRSVRCKGGKYRLEGLPAGSVVLRVMARDAKGNGLETTVDVEVRAGETVRGDVDLGGRSPHQSMMARL